MTRALMTALAILLPALAMAQDPGEIQRLFEAGRFQQVVAASNPASPPDVLYFAAQSQQKLGAMDQAAQAFNQLAARPEADPWHFIGLSGRQLVEELPSSPRSQPGPTYVHARSAGRGHFS